MRYRGLMKNLARAQTMFALANLYQLGESCSDRIEGAGCDRPSEPQATAAACYRPTTALLRLSLHLIVVTLMPSSRRIATCAEIP